MKQDLEQIILQFEPLKLHEAHLSAWQRKITKPVRDRRSEFPNTEFVSHSRSLNQWIKSPWRRDPVLLLPFAFWLDISFGKSKDRPNSAGIILKMCLMVIVLIMSQLPRKRELILAV